MKNKIVSLEELARVVADLKKKNKKIVTTNGCFDLLHLGHVRCLKKARSLGEILILGLNSDESVKKIKGQKRPLNNQEARAECLAELICVDYVSIFNDDSPEEFLKIVQPDIHVKGRDYEEKPIKEKELVESSGGKVVLIDIVEGYSTSDLIEKIRNL